MDPQIKYPTVACSSSLFLLRIGNLMCINVLCSYNNNIIYIIIIIIIIQFKAE